MAALMSSIPAFAAASLISPSAIETVKQTRFDVKSEARAVQFNRRALSEMQKQDELELALPNGSRHVVVFDRIDDHGGGIRSSIGFIKGQSNDYRVILTTGPGGTYGSIRTPETMYRIIPGANGQDLLIDMTEEQKHIPPINLGDDVRRIPEKYLQKPQAPLVNLANSKGNAEPGLTQAIPAPQATIDLMIVYTNGLAARLGNGMMTRFYNLVAAANTAYIDSEVGITLRLVNATMVNSSDTTTDNAALNAITPTDGGGVGVFANIEAIRNANGADLVAFLRNGDDFGGHGLAFLSTTTTPEANFLYSVITGCVVGCDTVFIHELGHNMGNAHDRATAAYQDGGVATPSGGVFPYSFGHYFCASGALSCNPNISPAAGGCKTDPTCSSSNVNNIGTIMSYFNPVTLKFSNPDVQCSQPNGTARPCGIANETDNARSMNNMRAAFAAVKPTMVAVPTGALQFSSNAFTANESTGTVNITVSRIGGSGGSVSVAYATSDGTAKAGFDYTAASGTLTWADGDTANKTITIPLVNDGVPEGGELFNMTLSNPSGATGVFLGFPTTAAVILADVWPPGGSFPADYVTPGAANVQWTTATDFASEGSTSLRSARVLGTDGTTFANSDLELTGSFPAGTVSFDYRVSSYSTDQGVLEFMIDNVVVFTSAGGETGWRSTTAPLAAGTHTLRWRFKNRLTFRCANGIPAAPGGAACADRAWIDAVSVPLNLVASATTLTTSQNPATAGQPVTFTATVTGGSGTPAGVATFRDGGTVITGCNVLTITLGVAQCTTSALIAGAHTITAEYSGNTVYDVSTSNSLALSINVPAATVPAAPTIGSATAGNAQAMVAFSAPQTNGGSAILTYTATCNPGALTATASTSPINVTGLTNGTVYACAVVANNVVGASAASATVSVTPSTTAAATFVNVVSRKTHGTVGAFDIPLAVGVGINGALSIEPRGIRTGHSIVFNFTNALTSPGTATVVDSGNNSVGAAASVSGNAIVVTIANLADNKRVTISLSGITSASGAVTAPPPVSMGFLVGDVNASRNVSAADIAGVKARFGQVVTENNFVYDVDSSGSIASADVSAVKARAGVVLN